jgi:hypothetical protein
MDKMNRFNRVRKPVKRHGAERYLLITLLSFAASVSLTRLFLQLTGYPKLGSGSLHIAHVLWGGLLLFVAALLPLILANRWVYDNSAILAGVGVGLFIDEVGKFITQNNDYFYPPAAPIIYAFFLVTVLIYLQLRRPPTHEPRTELYHALDAIEEVLDRDLEVQERDDLDRRLESITTQAEQYPDLASLATGLLQFLHNQDLVVIPDQPTMIERWLTWIVAWAHHHIDRARLRIAIVLGLGLTGIIALAKWIVFLGQSIGPVSSYQALVEMASASSVATPTGMDWFIARLILEGFVGMTLLAGSILITLKQVQRGMALGYYGLLLSLTTVDLLLFYFDQFSTILIALLQFTVLMGMIYYRKSQSKGSRVA